MPYEDDIFSDKNEVKSILIKFGKPGDAFKGTLLSVKEVSIFDKKEGKKMPKKIYEFKGQGGAFHDMIFNAEYNTYTPVEEETVVVPGEVYVLFSRGKKFDDEMKRAKPGNICGFRFEKRGEAKDGNAPAKIVKTYINGFDPEYMGETPQDLANALGGEVMPQPDFMKE